MAIDMPNAPSTGDIYLAPNGINYEWDGDKWVTYVDPSIGANLWDRNVPTSSVYPINAGDSLEIKNSGDTTTITLEDSGAITALKYNIDTLPSLP